MLLFYYLLTCFTYVMQPLIVIRDRLLVSHHRRYLALLAAHLQVSVFVLLSVILSYQLYQYKSTKC
jgi:hypothetical protein